MKNFLIRKNGGNMGGLDFWSDPFADFFKPTFYGDYGRDMRTDIKETDANYEISIDLAGYDKKDISVTLTSGYLTIEARRSESNSDNANYIKRERSVSCSRSYYVGKEVSQEEVSAKYENGTLSLIVPKATEKQIPSGNIEIL